MKGKQLMSDQMTSPSSSTGELAAHGIGRPVAHRRLIDRDDLLKQLMGSDRRPIVTMVAPAGYGKTSSISLWDDIDPRPFAWVRLDPLDDDAIHFARHVAAALNLVAPISDHDLVAVASIGQSLGDDLLPCLARLLVDRSPCVVVLDDVQVLRSPGAMTVLDGLLEAAPPGCQLVLAGRSLSGVPLARRRVQDEVAEFGAVDLSMSDAEAGCLLDAVDDDAADLVARAEGWPAGLRLMALAMSEDGVRSPGDASGRERLIFDYFAQEVLAPLPDELVTFLERASVLDAMSGPLLDALLDTDDSAVKLRDVEQSGNLFLVPLDHERGWYRYHTLFAQMLQRRLEIVDPAEARRLHRRASEVLEATGDEDGAIRHAIAAGDLGHAADLIFVRTTSLVFSGRVESLGSWLDLLGRDSMERWPVAAIAWAWYGLAVADPQLIHGAMNAAEPARHHGPLADGSPTVATALAIVKAMAGAEGVPGVLRDTEEARSGGGPAVNPWWGLATLVQGTAYSMLGRDDEARSRLELALSTIGDAPAFEACALAHLAILALRRGDLVNAERDAARALAIANRNHLGGVVPALPAFAVGALAAARTGRREEATSAAAAASDMIDRLDRLSPRTALLCNLLLAETALALGDGATALQRAELARAAQRMDPTATKLNDELEEVLRLLRDGIDWLNDDRQITKAELRVLTYLPTQLSFREIGEQLLVSRNTAKTHAVAIYRKLGVTTRTEAVIKARELGMLPASANEADERHWS